MFTGAIATLFAFASAPSHSEEWDKATQDALTQARDALIGRAASDDNRPGSLPCPDTDNDGIAQLLVGPECPSYVGRLPWKTLGLPDLRDSSGERLWYALSRSLRDDDSAQPINSVDTPGQISVVGSAPAVDIAAVVIAPGNALPGQIRNAAGIDNIVNYLEGENASAGDNVYETAARSPTFNDRIATVTRDQLFDVVEWRVAAEIRTALRRYYAAFGFFPYANDYLDNTYSCTNGTLRGRVPNADLAALYVLSAGCASHADWLPGIPPTAPPAWFSVNGWHRLTYYAVAPACTVATLNCSGIGLLTVNGTSGIGAVVIVGGRAIGAQVRPCTSANECIEQPNALLDQYVAQKRSTTYNDRVAAIIP